MGSRKPREGDIYEIVSIGGHSFTIRYGYYSEQDRLVTDPMPIYPCFISQPLYTARGEPLITRVQDACEYYYTEEAVGDGWCADCLHSSIDHKEIGICRCQHRKRTDIQTKTEIVEDSQEVAL